MLPDLIVNWSTISQGLFDNWWEIFGPNYELIGSSRDQLAGLYSTLLSSHIQ